MALTKIFTKSFIGILVVCVLQLMGISAGYANTTGKGDEPYPRQKKNRKNLNK